MFKGFRKPYPLEVLLALAYLILPLAWSYFALREFFGLEVR